MTAPFEASISVFFFARMSYSIEDLVHTSI